MATPHQKVTPKHLNPNHVIKEELGKIDLSILAEKWPSAIVVRDKSEDFSGGAMTAKYLANLDSRGEGPKGRFRLGRKVVYPVAEFVAWLEGRASRI